MTEKGEKPALESSSSAEKTLRGPMEGASLEADVIRKCIHQMERLSARRARFRVANYLLSFLEEMGEEEGKAVPRQGSLFGPEEVGFE